MFQCFFPDCYMRSAYEIDYMELYKKGCRGIIFDIDNTLVEHGAPADERSRALIKELKAMGYRILFLSNNKEPRVRLFNDAVQAEYIFKAGKPKRAGYQKAMEIMHTGKSETLFVGDQLFTDVWGARRTGIYSILVQPINKKEEIQIVLKRCLEKIVLRAYKRDCKKKGRPFLTEKKSECERNGYKNEGS